jgi:Flp pilus assembly CpaF family ATPase
MRITYGNVISPERTVYVASGNRVRIGRDKSCDLVVNHPSVPPEGMAIHVRNAQWEVVVLGPAPVVLGNQRLRTGERAKLEDGQILQLWPYSFHVDLPLPTETSEDAGRAELDLELSGLVAAIHVELLRRMDLAYRGKNPDETSDEYLLAVEHNIDELSKQFGLFTTARAKLTDHVAGLTVRHECLESLISRTESSVWTNARKKFRLHTAVPERENELLAVVERVSNRLELASMTDLSEQIRRVENGFWNVWAAVTPALFTDFRHYLAGRCVKKDLLDVLFGYGPLDDLLRTPTVSEIMVVDRDRIFIEKQGVLENSGRRFISDDVTVAIIERIVTLCGRRIDKSSPLVDARLSDGSRVNAVIPPLAVSGPCLTIRKFPARKMQVKDLVARNALTQAAAEFLQACVLARKNIIVSGGTGTGKTTLLNCLSDYIPDKERIVTIEDTAELQLKKPHVVRLEAKPANVEGKGAYSIRDLVKNSLRMRPDRIVVGECRSGEALDMLQAMNTGHDGSMTTLHANSSEDAVLRLEVLVQTAADLPVLSIHRQISSAVDVIVQLHRLRSGRRVISQISEVVGIDHVSGRVQIRDLFAFPEGEHDQTLGPTGSLPTFITDLMTMGGLKLDLFYQ